MRVYRFNVERRSRRRVRLQWLGPVRTYTLLTRWTVRDRANW